MRQALAVGAPAPSLPGPPSLGAPLRLPPGLGSGAIAGIVLGTLLGLLLLAAAGYLLWRRVGR